MKMDIACLCRLPVLWQQFFELVNFMVRDSGEHIFEPLVGLYLLQLAGSKKGLVRLKNKRGCHKQPLFRLGPKQLKITF